MGEVREKAKESQGESMSAELYEESESFFSVPPAENLSAVNYATYHRGFDASNSDLSCLTDSFQTLSSDVKSLENTINVQMKAVVDENTGLRNYIKDIAVKTVEEMEKLREEVSRLRRKKTPIEKLIKWTKRVFKV